MGLLTLIVGLLWLDGPGLRWLLPLAAQPILRSAGFQGGLRIEGSLSGGLAVADLNLRGTGTLVALTIVRATPHYRWSRLLRGKLDGLSLAGVHADLCLNPDPVPKTQGKPRSDFDQIIEILRRVRTQFVPLQLDFADMSLSVTRAGKPAFTLQPSSLSHAPDSSAITLKIGAITDPIGCEWSAQTTRLVWSGDQISLDHLTLLPGLGVSGLALHLPTVGGPSLESLIRLDEAVLHFETSAGLAEATLALQSGSVDLAKTAESLGIQLPASATVTALTLDASNLMPDLSAVTGHLKLALKSISWRDWTMPEARVAGTLTSDRASLNLQTLAMGSLFLLDANLALTRNSNHFVPGAAAGTFHLSDVPAVLHELSAHFQAIRADADVPPSSLDGSFHISGTDPPFQTASLDTTLTPADPALATPLALHALWQADHSSTAELTLDGLKLTAHLNPSANTYSGELTLNGFSTSRIARWLEPVGISPGSIANLTGEWQGTGDLSNARHSGELTLTRAAWQSAENPPVTAAATVSYVWPGQVAVSHLAAQYGPHSLTLDCLQAAWPQPEISPSGSPVPIHSLWPANVTLHGLTILTANQALACDVALADGLLALDSFTWRDGETLLAEGCASLPVPRDFTQWRDTLAKDSRPASVTLQSRVLALSLLQPWLPVANQLDPRTTAQCHINLSGNYAEPAIDASLECINIRTAANPKLPPAALKLALKSAADRLNLNGSLTTPDYPPAVLSASMVFRPAVWAATPDTLDQEEFSAEAALPRLDLSRFTSLLPSARQLSGVLTGNLKAAGKFTAPDLLGSLHLTNAGIVFHDPKLPQVQAAAADIDLTLKTVTLKNLRAEIAGGSLTGGGTLSLSDGVPASLDFRLRGDHLPLLRNDQLILRANIDLRLQGPWQTAALTGTVGAVDSLFYRDIELLPLGMPMGMTFTVPAVTALPKIDAPQAYMHALPAPFDAWSLNLALRTQDPFLIHGNLATGRVDANLRLGGTLGTPQTEGTLTLTDFSAALPFSTLKVKSGLLRFTPGSGFDPSLELRGTAEPRPYRVDFYAYGRLSYPQLVLTSNPPLPENEIMTLLATGTTSAGLENTQAASSRAIQLFAEEVRRGRVPYSRQLRPLLGLFDRVDFSLAETDPYTSGSLSTATINLSDHWLVSAGMGQDGSSRVMGIWRVSFR